MPYYSYGLCGCSCAAQYLVNTIHRLVATQLSQNHVQLMMPHHRICNVLSKLQTKIATITTSMNLP